MNEDGKVIIGIHADSSKFDKQLKTLEKQYANKEIDLNLSAEELSKAESSLKLMEDEANRLDNKYTDINNKIKEQENLISRITKKNTDGTISIPNENLSAYNKALSDIQMLRTQQKGMLTDIETNNQAIDKQEKIVSKISARYEKQKNDLQEIGNKIQNVKVSQVQSQTEGISKSISGVISKMGRWALAVFGIRSAYMAIRNAINVISSQDEQLKADIEYMKNALAYTLEPIVRAIVNLAKQLMFYVGYVVKAWTGKNIFENANKSLGGATKNAKALNKEIQKTLASGIDEITNLETSTGGGGGDDTGGGGVLPSFDLTNMDMPVPEWLQWIADNGPLVVSILAGIVGALIALKLGFSALQALGIGLAITGILIAIQGLLGYLQNPSWENFGKIIAGIGIAIIGLGAIIGSLPVAIVGAIIAIVGIIVMYWKQIKAFLQGGIDWLTGKSDWVHEMFGDTIGDIYDLFVQNLQAILDYFDGVFTAMKGILDGIIEFVKGVFSGNWEQAWNGVKKIFTSLLNGMKQTFISFLTIITNMAVAVGKGVGGIIVGAFKGVVNAVLWTIENVLNTPIRTINSLIGIINKVPGVNLGKLETFKLPRLASGGIVNNPGRGVMMGSYIAGERGAEAIVPLQNSGFIKDFAKLVAENMQADNTDLLLELNKNVLEMASKPTILNINGKEVAQAIHTDLKNEDNRINTSSAISIK